MSNRIQPKYTYTIISVALVLLLVAVLCTAWLYGDYQIKTLQERTSVLIEMHDAAAPEDIETLTQSLRKTPYVRSETVKFISKKEAFEQLKSDLGDDALLADLPNPLYDGISFYTTPGHSNADSLLMVKLRLKENPAVADVHYEVFATSNIRRNVNNIVIMGLVVCALFLLIAVTLIHNTIRLTLYSDRFIIKNMELVGASWGFISRPYLLRSIGHGVLSAIMACSILAALYAAAWGNIPMLESVIRLKLFWLIPVIVIALGIAISAASTWFVVNKYLRMRIDDLY